jgi:hypothetical protein
VCTFFWELLKKINSTIPGIVTILKFILEFGFILSVTPGLQTTDFYHHRYCYNFPLSQQVAQPTCKLPQPLTSSLLMAGGLSVPRPVAAQAAAASQPLSLSLSLPCNIACLRAFRLLLKRPTSAFSRIVHLLKTSTGLVRIGPRS